MKLGLKLALGLVTVVVPLTIIFALFQLGAERRALLERSADRSLTRIQERGAKFCDRERFRNSRKRRGMHFVTYDAELRPLAQAAPDFPFSMSAVSSDGPVHRQLWFSEHSGVSAIQTSNPNCPYVAAFWRGAPPRLSASKIIGPTLALALLLLVTGLAIGWPLVRRIRRLTQAVEGASESGYRIEVETDSPDEIGELARAFDAVGQRVTENIDALERRDRTLKEYVANTTHDLALPVTVIQHRLHELRKTLGEDTEARELIDVALEESHYIGALVKNMNVASKLDADAHALQTHACNLNELCERVMNRHKPLAKTKKLKFFVGLPEEPLVAECDSVLVEQALSNLVQNAVQYTPRDGHVSLVLEEHNSSFRIWVKDDGPGIPPELRPRVLERDIRGDAARSRNPEGQGFGLNIARRVCELHGWTLEFEDTQVGLTVLIKGPTHLIENERTDQ